MTAPKITSGWKDGKRNRRRLRRLLAWLGVEIEVIERCKLGAVVSFPDRMRPSRPTGPELN